MLQYLPVKDETLCQIQNLSQEDAILKTLARIIKQGWPESKLHLPLEVQDYFPFKEELTLQTGVIFKGDRVVIPLQMRAELKRKLHSSHLGVQTCQRRAQKAFYWPGMYKEIEECLQVPSLQYILPRAAEGAHDLTPSTIKTVVGPCWPGLPCHH